MLSKYVTFTLCLLLGHFALVVYGGTTMCTNTQKNTKVFCSDEEKCCEDNTKCCRDGLSLWQISAIVVGGVVVLVIIIIVIVAAIMKAKKKNKVEGIDQTQMNQMNPPMYNDPPPSYSADGGTSFQDTSVALPPAYSTLEKKKPL